MTPTITTTETWRTTLLFIHYKVLRSGELKPIAFINPIGKTWRENRKKLFAVITTATVPAPLVPAITNAQPFHQVTVEVDWQRKEAKLITISANPLFTYPEEIPMPKPAFSKVKPYIPENPFEIPTNCPLCHSQVIFASGKHYCSRPDVCPAQRGNQQTVKAANPGYRISYPMFVTDEELFIHACNLYGAIPIPTNFKETSYNFMVLAQSEETFGLIGYYMGLYTPDPVPFERQSTAEIIASTKACLRDYDYL